MLADWPNSRIRGDTAQCWRVSYVSGSIRMNGMAPGLPSKLSRQTRGLRLAYSAPEPDNCTLEELHRLMLPATKALPFVKLRADDQPWWHPESYWSVRPTGNRGTDVELGRAYARKAIAAMKADHNRGLVSLIIRDIIHDAANRSVGGRLSCLALGFLNEISHQLGAAGIDD
jgi:hypothetical protein